MKRIAVVLLWVLQPLLDKHTQRPSGPRTMAWAILALTAMNRPVPVAIAALLLATMWGYSMFKDTIAKTTLTLAATDAVSVKYEKTVAEQRTIAERDPVRGFDPSKPRPDPDHQETP